MQPQLRVREVVQTVLVRFVNLSERNQKQGGLMLTRLIESQPRFMRNEFGTAASVAIHLVLITVAAYFTTAKAITESETEQPRPLVWIKTIPPPHTSDASRRTTQSSSSQRPSISSPSPVSLAINPNIPSIDVELAVARSTDFGEGVKGPATGETAPTGTSADNSGAFDALEVDSPASAMSGVVPAYPPSLRAAGIEGRVIAQFVVDAKGRAVRESIRIVSSTNDLFGESVRKAIEQMRFAPARIGSKPVAQMVQQLFVFKLDR
jgi:protein TonB